MKVTKQQVLAYLAALKKEGLEEMGRVAQGSSERGHRLLAEFQSSTISFYGVFDRDVRHAVGLVEMFGPETVDTPKDEQEESGDGVQ